MEESNNKPNIEEIKGDPDIMEEHNTKLGLMLGVMLIILILILGGLYMWGAALERDLVVEEVEIPNNEPETPRANADTQILETVSTSDSLEAIEADVSSTNLDGLDTDLVTIENEINSAID